MYDLRLAATKVPFKVVSLSILYDIYKEEYERNGASTSLYATIGVLSVAATITTDVFSRAIYDKLFDKDYQRGYYGWHTKFLLSQINTSSDNEEVRATQLRRKNRILELEPTYSKRYLNVTRTAAAAKLLYGILDAKRQNLSLIDGLIYATIVPSSVYYYSLRSKGLSGKQP